MRDIESIMKEQLALNNDNQTGKVESLELLNTELTQQITELKEQMSEFKKQMTDLKEQINDNE
jgi:hypothetical protein